MAPIALHTVNQATAVQGAIRDDLADGRTFYALEWLLLERPAAMPA
ncbi:hypothetical protein [Mycobacterium sp. KBS0706]|nr:hypothetical protein [Mycobacterium sp. KBS0706]